MQLVKITWIDSVGVTTDWEFTEDLPPLVPERVCTVGYVTDETDEYITVAQSICDEQVLGRMTIPKGCIVSRRRLR